MRETSENVFQDFLKENLGELHFSCVLDGEIFFI